VFIPSTSLLIYKSTRSTKVNTGRDLPIMSVGKLGEEFGTENALKSKLLVKTDEVRRTVYLESNSVVTQ